MRRPPTTFTAGVNVTVQGINVSANSQRRMIIASRVARHYELVSCDLKPTPMKWKVIKDIDLKLTSLEDKNNHVGLYLPVMNKKYH